MDLTRGPSALLSLISFVVFGPDVLAKGVSSGTSVSTAGQEVRPRVVKRSTRDCDSTFEHYCMNKGQCMLLVDINEHHCKCETGFYGPRCGNLEFVTQPVTEEQIVATVFCVSLLLIGLAGALFFFYKWYKKNKLTKKTGLITAGAQTLVLVGSVHHANADHIKSLTKTRPCVVTPVV